MTGNVKGKVAHESHADVKMKEQKIADKATRATEKMHTNVTASLDQLQHAGVEAPAVSHDVKTGNHKAVAGARMPPHHAGSPMKRM